MIIQLDDKIITFRNQQYVVAVREVDDEHLDLKCGPVSSTNPNEFDPQVSWGFNRGLNREPKQWLQDENFIAMLNTQFQAKFGEFTPAEQAEWWRQIARFLAANLEFNPATGFSLK